MELNNIKSELIADLYKIRTETYNTLDALTNRLIEIKFQNIFVKNDSVPLNEIKNINEKRVDVVKNHNKIIKQTINDRKVLFIKALGNTQYDPNLLDNLAVQLFNIFGFGYY